MSLLYTVLAADPATPGPLLARLFDLATASIGPGAGRYAPERSEAVTLLRELVLNPSLPADVRDRAARMPTLVVRRALLDQPGMTVERALQILGADRRVALLRHAVAVVPDPDGVLARDVMGRSDAKWLLADVLAATGTAEQARLEAAIALAGKTGLHRIDVVRVLRLARRHPGALEAVQAVATDPQLRTELATLAAAADAAGTAPEPVPGRVRRPALLAWLAHPERTPEQVAAYVRAEPRQMLVRATVGAYLDPSGLVAGAALDRHESVSVARAVLAHAGTPAPVRQRAAARVAGPGAGLGYPVARQIHELIRLDPAFADQVALTCGDAAVLRRVMTVPGLGPAAVAAIGARITNPADRELRAGLYDWLWLVTHPATPAAARPRLRAGLAAWLVTHPGLARGVPGKHAWVLEWADAAVAADRVGPAEAVAAVSCAAVRSVDGWNRAPGVVRLLAAALGEALAEADAAVTGQVLTTLADSFPGTVGELLTTVVGVAA